MTLISIVVASVAIITYITDIKEMIILDEVIIVGSLLILIIDFIFTGWKDTLMTLLNVGGLYLIMLIIKFLGDKL